MQGTSRALPLSPATTALVGNDEPDRERVIEGIGGSCQDDGPSKSELATWSRSLHRAGF
jgi:hypothetical protein